MVQRRPLWFLHVGPIVATGGVFQPNTAFVGTAGDKRGLQPGYTAPPTDRYDTPMNSAGPEKFKNLRRAAVAGSAGLFAIAVLQAQQGCDAKTPEASKPTPAEKSTPDKSPETPTPNGAPVPAAAPAPDVTPVPNAAPVPSANAAPVAPTAPATPAAPTKKKTEKPASNDTPKERAFFPASKSGIVRTSPAANAAPTQQTK